MPDSFNNLYTIPNSSSLNQHLILALLEALAAPRIFLNGKDYLAMAKITFNRSGGFIGQALKFELNLNSLPIHAVRNITRLVEEAQFFDLPENLIKNFKPDEYQYTITVDAGITYHTVHTNDSTMPSSLRPLVKELSLLSTTQQDVNVGGIR